jgi:hypothetical protein
MKINVLPEKTIWQFARKIECLFGGHTVTIERIKTAK